jgi:DNA-binding response OmpR family regulator
VARNDYSDVRAALIEDNSLLRGELRAALAAKGILNPIVCRDPQSFVAAVATESPDIIICDSNTLGGDFPATIQRIRRNDLGGNPFAVVVATVHDASMDGVRAAMDSGVDHLLLKPTQVGRVMDRVGALVWERQPFVVTQGYVGPTRRSRKRASDSKDVLLDAPNTLRSKVVDKMSEDRIKAMLDRAVAGLQEKMSAYPLLGIDRLIQRTLSYGTTAHGTEALKSDFAYLMEIGRELSERYRGTAFAHIAELAVALANLAKHIASKHPGELRAMDLDPLSNLGEIIRRAVAAEEHSSGESPFALAGASRH